MSKGSVPRPFSVDAQTFAANWDAIFNGARLGANADSKPADIGPIPIASATPLFGAYTKDNDREAIYPIYIDDSTGATVTSDWWPGDPIPTQGQA